MYDTAAASFALPERAGRPYPAVDQEQLRTAKLEMLGELVGGIAHEINNPLFGILGLVEFLLAEIEPGTKAHGRVRLVQQSGLEIKEITHAILGFAREPVDAVRQTRLQDVVADAVNLARCSGAAKTLDIVERGGDEPLAVTGSPNQLKLAVLALLGAARRSLREGGTITIDVERDGDAALVRVSDTGPARGVDDVELAVAIARAHGGDLVAATTPARTAFVLRLPTCEAA